MNAVHRPEDTEQRCIVPKSAAHESEEDTVAWEADAPIAGPAFRSLVRRSLIRPKDAAPLLDLGHHLAALEWVDAALGAYQLAAKRERRGVEATVEAARLLVNGQHATEAVALLTSTLSRMPAEFNVRLMLAHAHFQCNQLADAERHYQALMRTYPHCLPAMRGLVDVAIARGELSLALRRFFVLRSAQPLVDEDLARWGRIQCASGQFRMGRRTLLLADARGLDDPCLDADLALSALACGDVRAAEGHLRAAGSVHPRLYEAQCAVALSRGEPAKAAKTAQDAVAMPISDPSLRLRLVALRGEAELMVGRASQAWASWTEVLAALPAAADAAVDARLAAEVRTAFSASAWPTFARNAERSPAIVFLVGAPGSGRGLLARILGASMGTRLRVGPYGASALRDRAECLTGESYPRAVSRLRVPMLADLAQRYIANEPVGGALWVDADPNTRDLVGLLALVFPRARFVFAERETSDLAVSNVRRAAFRPPVGSTLSHIVTGLGTWSEQLVFWKERLGDRALSVRYEDLVEHPVATTRMVLSFAGLPLGHEAAMVRSLTPRGVGALPVDEGSVGLGLRVLQDHRSFA